MTHFLFYVQRGQKNPVTVNLKAEVVIKILEFKIKASTTTLQYLSDNAWVHVAILYFCSPFRKMNLQHVLFVLTALISQCQSDSCDSAEEKVPETVQSHLTNTVKKVVQDFFSNELARKDEKISSLEEQINQLQVRTN